MDTNRAAARDLLLLSRIPGIGPARLRALVDHFGDARAVAQAHPRDLIRIHGIEQKTALAITAFFRQGGPPDAHGYVEDQLARMEKGAVCFASIWDEPYPAHLRKIYDPPPFLFYRGTLLERDAAAIAIVGTRTPSPYGIRIADRFASGLAGRGITVVSGLARGIDTVAHGAALRAGGRTLAVIGSGLDVLYPPENRALAARIEKSGAVVSEFPMGTKPDAMNFPQRNRIVSGISLGTLVVETGTEGGAMITARTALDQNREVFAIPAPVDASTRSGTNRLLRDGHALLTETIDDILTELRPHLQGLIPDLPVPQPQEVPVLTLFEQRVADVISQEPVHIDWITERSSLSSAETLVHLLSLECKGLVRQLPGKHFVRA